MSALRAVIPGLASGAAVLFAALAQYAPPEPELSVSQWAATHRYVGAESQSRFPGKWSNARGPYLIEPMDACQIGNGIRKVVLTGSAQFGKSECPINAVAQNICSNQPVSWAVILPAGEEITKYSEAKFDANVEASPAWRERVYLRKSRSSEGSTTRVKRFRGGSVRLLTAGSSKPLQMMTFGAVIFEELAQYEAEVGEGGDPIAAAEQRMSTFGLDGKSIYCSTPGFAGRCRITKEYEDSDMRRWHTPCLHCGDFQVLAYETMSEFEGRPVFACISCGVIIEESDRDEMNERGVWVPTFAHPEPDADTRATNEDLAAKMDAARAANPPPPRAIPAADIDRWRNRDCEGRHRGYWLWKAQSNLASWVLIAEDRAKLLRGDGGIPFAIEFAQKTLGVAYEEVVDRPDTDKLYEARGRIYPREGVVPPWASIITGFMDVQHNRIEWAVWAFGRGGVGARIRKGIIAKNPNDWATWRDSAHAVVMQEFAGPAHTAARADYWGVDLGGTATDDVYRFVLAHRSLNVLALKGSSHDKGYAPPIERGKVVRVKYKGRTIGKLFPYLTGTHSLKTRIYHGLQQGRLSAEEKPPMLLSRSLHLPLDATKTDFEQLTAEYLKQPDPRARGEWTLPAGKANEQLDIAVGCLALAIMEGLDVLSETGWSERHAARMPDIAANDLTPLERLAMGKKLSAPAESGGGGSLALASETEGADSDVGNADADIEPALTPPPAEGSLQPRGLTDAEKQAVADIAKAWG